MSKSPKKFFRKSTNNKMYTILFSEKEDELIRNRGKCTEHNQILAHIREKMHHTDEQIDFAECNMGEAQIDYLGAREELGFVKVCYIILYLSIHIYVIVCVYIKYI